MLEKINIWKKTEKEPKVELLREQIDEIESEKRKNRTMTKAEEQAANDRINRLKRKIQFYEEHNQDAKDTEHAPEPEPNNSSNVTSNKEQKG